MITVEFVDGYLAGQGINKAWAKRHELLSPCYTTRLCDIPVARLTSW
ncbi:DUF4113 domain-containing protein [Serratia proteamaculans]|nr:DUF4113 domain-containing protein [Serratia proteamaculans]